MEAVLCELMANTGIASAIALLAFLIWRATGNAPLTRKGGTRRRLSGKTP